MALSLIYDLNTFLDLIFDFKFKNKVHKNHTVLFSLF